MAEELVYNANDLLRKKCPGNIVVHIKSFPVLQAAAVHLGIHNLGAISVSRVSLSTNITMAEQSDHLYL